MKKSVELSDEEYDAVEQRKAELGYRTDREALLRGLGLEYAHIKTGRKRNILPAMVEMDSDPGSMRPEEAKTELSTLRDSLEQTRIQKFQADRETFQDDLAKQNRQMMKKLARDEAE